VISSGLKKVLKDILLVHYFETFIVNDSHGEGSRLYSLTDTGLIGTCVEPV